MEKTSTMAVVSHHTIRESLLQRIRSGEWSLGSLIPGEIQLAEEYGCARTTVNRALRTLAEQGLVVRKRKGGTRILHRPTRPTKLHIPIVREQVETNGALYRHHLKVRKEKTPPATIRQRLGLGDGQKALYLETVHWSDETPFAFETRWVSLSAVPDIKTAPLEKVSVNEWLVQFVPFSSGEVSFSAAAASHSIARAMQVEPGEALFHIDRTTRLDALCITTMSLYYQPGYRLDSTL